MDQVNVIGFMALNFFTSVAIIWTNKLAYISGFVFATTLTVIHFLFTFWGLFIASNARFRLFERKRIPILHVMPISLAFCGFVVFNNLSLQHNPVGTYQLLKVLTTPTIVLIQYICYDTRLPTIQIISLVPVCVGVIIATVSSLEANWKGSLFGVAGIASTSVYQIWVKTELGRLQCTSEQLLFYQAPLSAFLLLVSLPVTEKLDELISGDWISLAAIWWTVTSSVLAFLVNLSIFLVIGKTSPVSYNVLGHGKLCVILISGYVFFGEECNIRNIIGVVLAVGGIVWYTHLKLMENKHVPVSGSAKPEEKEPLTSDSVKE
jgi:solute carrier family 35 protein E3